MYIIDFFKNLFKKNNIGILIWMILNSVLVTVIFGTLVFYSFANIPSWLGYVIGFAMYIVSITLALSPLGEKILVIQQGCKKIKDPAILNRLEPLFREVQSKAVVAEPNLSRNIKFFMSNDDSPNAFATGRSVVCVTRGLLNFSDEEIKATLAHEFGHLAHKDTDAILVVAVGNLIVSLFFLIYRVVFRIISWIFMFTIGLVSKSIGTVIISALTRVFIDAVLGVIIWLWTKIGVLLCLASGRSNEYKADEFAYNLGYGKQLCSVLSKLGSGSSKGLWAALNSSHPDTSKRIAKLQSYSPALVLDRSFNSNGSLTPPTFM